MFVSCHSMCCHDTSIFPSDITVVHSVGFHSDSRDWQEVERKGEEEMEEMGCGRVPLRDCGSRYMVFSQRRR